MARTRWRCSRADASTLSGPPVANEHEKKRRRYCGVLYLVSLSTDVALQGRYAVGDLSASPMLDHIMLSPNGPPAGTAGN